MTIGERIKQARLAAGLSRRVLAETIGVKGGQTTVYRWEVGDREPDLETVGLIASVTSTTPAWIVYGVVETQDIQN